MAKKEVKEKKQKNTSYFKEMKAELKKVVWPTPKELLNNTVAVIGFVIIIAVIVFILDLCFDNVNKYGITKLQEKVQSSFSTTEGENTQNNEENENNDASTDTVEGESLEASQNEEAVVTTNDTATDSENNE